MKTTTIELFQSTAPSVLRIAGQFIGQPLLISEASLMAAAAQYIQHRLDDSKAASGDSKPTGPQVVITENGIAIIPIAGVIGRGFDDYDQAHGCCDVDVLEERVEAAMNDENVRGVIFVVNSPGGSATRVAEVAGTIAQLSACKPTAAFVDELCASAAMWLASQCHMIYATKSAEVGSIGVYMMHMDYTGLLNKLGMQTTVIKAGTRKAVGALGQPLTDDGKAYLQEGVDDLYTMFTSAVRAGRSGSTIEDSTMQGQCFIASKAKDRGLVDDVVGCLDDCVAQMSEAISMGA